MSAQQYVSNELMDKSPVELIRLLYSKAIEKLHLAARHTQHAQVRERNACLARVMEIVAELQGSLNLEDGGELALELARLYDYVQRRLIEAAGDPGSRAQIEEVSTLLGNLCDGWTQCEPPVLPEEPRHEFQDPFEAGVEETDDVQSVFPGDEIPAPIAPSDEGLRERHAWTL